MRRENWLVVWVGDEEGHDEDARQRAAAAHFKRVPGDSLLRVRASLRLSSPAPALWASADLQALSAALALLVAESFRARAGDYCRELRRIEGGEADARELFIVRESLALLLQMARLFGQSARQYEQLVALVARRGEAFAASLWPLPASDLPSDLPSDAALVSLRTVHQRALELAVYSINTARTRVLRGKMGLAELGQYLGARLFFLLSHQRRHLRATRALMQVADSAGDALAAAAPTPGNPHPLLASALWSFCACAQLWTLLQREERGEHAAAALEAARAAWRHSVRLLALLHALPAAPEGSQEEARPGLVDVSDARPELLLAITRRLLQGRTEGSAWLALNLRAVLGLALAQQLRTCRRLRLAALHFSEGAEALLQLGDLPCALEAIQLALAQLGTGEWASCLGPQLLRRALHCAELGGRFGAACEALVRLAGMGLAAPQELARVLGAASQATSVPAHRSLVLEAVAAAPLEPGTDLSLRVFVESRFPVALPLYGLELRYTTGDAQSARGVLRDRDGARLEPGRNLVELSLRAPAAGAYVLTSVRANVAHPCLTLVEDAREALEACPVLVCARRAQVRVQCSAPALSPLRARDSLDVRLEAGQGFRLLGAAVEATAESSSLHVRFLPEHTLSLPSEEGLVLRLFFVASASTQAAPLAVQVALAVTCEVQDAGDGRRADCVVSAACELLLGELAEATLADTAPRSRYAELTLRNVSPIRWAPLRYRLVDAEESSAEYTLCRRATTVESGESISLAVLALHAHLALEVVFARLAGSDVAVTFPRMHL